MQLARRADEIRRRVERSGTSEAEHCISLQTREIFFPFGLPHLKPGPLGFCETLNKDRSLFSFQIARNKIMDGQSKSSGS
jgi:hypothetical protein